MKRKTIPIDQGEMSAASDSKRRERRFAVQGLRSSAVALNFRNAASVEMRELRWRP